MIIGEVQKNNEVIISMIKTWKRLFDRAHYHAVDGSYWWTIRQKAQSGGQKDGLLCAITTNIMITMVRTFQSMQLLQEDQLCHMAFMVCLSPLGQR